MKVLVAGCGYVGEALGRALLARGDEVVGLKRRAERLPDGFQPISADLTQPDSLAGVPGDVEALVYCTGSRRRDVDAYDAIYVQGLTNILSALTRANAPLERVLFTSSTAVYEHDDGRWVDEESPAEPSAPTSKRLIEAERIASSAVHHSTVLRLGGIYGPGRTSLLERLRRGDVPAPASALYTNRIHREDCAGALAHLLTLEAPPALVLCVDDEPVPLGELYSWLASRLGVATPTEAGDGPQGRFRTSKRCRNDRLLASGYALQFSSYREGYEALLSGARA